MRSLFKKGAADDKKATHRIADFAFVDPAAEVAAEVAQQLSISGKVTKTGTVDMTAAHHDVNIRRFNHVQHGWEKRLIVL